MKRLYKSSRNKILTGVFGGIAEYLDADASIIRLAGVLLIFLTGFFPGAIIYIIAALIIPPEPSQPGGENR